MLTAYICFWGQQSTNFVNKTIDVDSSNLDKGASDVINQNEVHDVRFNLTDLPDDVVNGGSITATLKTGTTEIHQQHTELLQSPNRAVVRFDYSDIQNLADSSAVELSISVTDSAGNNKKIDSTVKLDRQAPSFSGVTLDLPDTGGSGNPSNTINRAELEAANTFTITLDSLNLDGGSITQARLDTPFHAH